MSDINKKSDEVRSKLAVWAEEAKYDNKRYSDPQFESKRILSLITALESALEALDFGINMHNSINDPVRIVTDYGVVARTAREEIARILGGEK